MLPRCWSAAGRRPGACVVEMLSPALMPFRRQERGRVEFRKVPVTVRVRSRSGAIVEWEDEGAFIDQMTDGIHNAGGTLQESRGLVSHASKAAARAGLR